MRQFPWSSRAIRFNRAGTPPARKKSSITYSPEGFKLARNGVLRDSLHRGQQQFPAYCPAGPMLPQEQVLEFLIFEISSCVGRIG